MIDLANEYKCIFIKGNHDVWCEEWLRTGKPETKWLIHGGQATRDSYANVSEYDRRMHLHFLERMKLFCVDAENRLYIHAGFTSMHGPEQEFYDTNFTWDRTLWEMALAVEKSFEKDSPFYPKRLNLYSEIYIGHTPTTNYNVGIPMQGCNVWNVDTGGAFKGKLSMLDVDTKYYWQSEPVCELYPNEVGRNK